MLFNYTFDFPIRTHTHTHIETNAHTHTPNPSGKSQIEKSTKIKSKHKPCEWKRNVWGSLKRRKCQQMKLYKRQGRKFIAQRAERTKNGRSLIHTDTLTNTHTHKHTFRRYRIGSLCIIQDNLIPRKDVCHCDEWRFSSSDPSWLECMRMQSALHLEILSLWKRTSCSYLTIYVLLVLKFSRNIYLKKSKRDVTEILRLLKLSQKRSISLQLFVFKLCILIIETVFVQDYKCTQGHEIL